MESSRGEEMLEALSSRVELSQVADILRMYGKALTGAEVAVHSSEALAEKGIGWVETEAPSTEGTAIFLPPHVEEFADKDAELPRLQGLLHAPGRPPRVRHVRVRVRPRRAPSSKTSATPSRRSAPPPATAAAPPLDSDGHVDAPGEALPEMHEPLTDMERFFDLFPDRRLASDLFAIIEDARIDVLIGKEYGGIRRAYGDRQERELGPPPRDRADAAAPGVRREPGARQPRRASSTCSGREQLMPLMAEAVGVVAHAAAAAGHGRRLRPRRRCACTRSPSASRTSSRKTRCEDWMEFDEENMKVSPMSGGVDGRRHDIDMPQGEPVPYESPQPVDFRGEFKPETVQLLMKLRNQRHDKENASPLSPEQLKQMLEKSVEITISDMAEADLTQSSELFLTNLIKELNQQQQDDKSQKPQPMPHEGRPAGHRPEHRRRRARAGQRAQVLLLRRVGLPRRRLPPALVPHRRVQRRRGRGRVLRPDAAASTPRSSARRAASSSCCARRCSARSSACYDGEEIDFDAVMDYAVERKAGVTPTDKVYWRRNKIERDVSVAFLLDMSASTDEEIAKHERKYQQDEFDDDPRRYFSWWMARRAQELLTPPKRIIDLEKESIVLLIKALETIGDSYGIYGFSGYGRENVEFYVVKDLEEQFGERRQAAHRQDRAGPLDAHGPGDPPRHREAGGARLEGAHPLPGLRRPAAGPRLRPRPHGEGVRHPRHAHGADGGQAQGDGAVLPDGGPLRPRLPEDDVRGHRLRGGAGHRVAAAAGSRRCTGS